MMDEFNICLSIKEFNTIINTKISEGLKTKGLTQAQITAIKFIAHEKKLTLTELSEKMAIKKSTCSGIVDRLEVMDILTRIKDKNDKRVSYIQFSAKGKEFAREIKGDMNSIFSEVFSDVPVELLQSIGKDLQQVINIIKK
ncbi:MAG: MarR family winged helix-turn-helix transcriptional regulator [Sarcina sp.]